MATGTISAIRGVVVDVDFPSEDLPEIYEALTVDGPSGELVLEVQQHLGGGMVRTVAMGSTDGIPRGVDVVATGGADQGAGRPGDPGSHLQRHRRGH